jgi:PEGA domain
MFQASILHGRMKAEQILRGQLLRFLLVGSFLLVVMPPALLAVGQYSLPELLSRAKLEPAKSKLTTPLKLDRVELPEGGGWSGVLDDRWHSSDAFSGNFRDEFLDGLEFYLKQRGFVLADSPDAILVRVALEHFEGRKRVHEDGGDLRGTLTLVRDGQTLGSRTLFESLNYRDESDECPAFEKELGISKVGFSTVLFYRLSLSFYRSIEAGILDSVGGKAVPGPSTLGEGENAGRGSASAQDDQRKTGLLTIESVPQDVEILLDGNLIATTPAKQLRLPVGKHSLVLRKTGYQEWKREVMVLEGSNLTLKAEMEKSDR